MSRADTREDKRRLEVLRRAGWEITALKYGDYDGYDAVGKLWCIEHKTVEKLIGDMVTGTLIRQCRGLIEHSDFPILMIEGHWIQGKNGVLYNSGITWTQAWNQLQTIQDMGCRLQLTTSLEHTVERLFELEVYYRKESHPSALREISGDPYVVVLSLVDGISTEKAKALEVAHPTLANIAVASPGQLQGIKGIGEVLAKRIWQFFRTDYVRRDLQKDLELWE